MSEVQYIEITKEDKLKIKAVAALLRNHCRYTDMTFDQVKAFEAVLDYMLSLPRRFEAAKPIEVPAAPELTETELKAKVRDLGYEVLRKED